MNKVTISTCGFKFEAEIYDTPTGQKIMDALPIKGNTNLWGEEIYFSIPVYADEEADAHEIVEPGELAYWPIGSAFCIFFGPTPASRDKRPRAYSNVNVFGKITGDLSKLHKVSNGAEITIS